ncbi:30S ribosomal protein S18 [Gracilariopsis chorda]|uniref:30S ribosomal protein S18 n=1 Tax=Gracilariopsis chorda TaxID=448386 RepID=A0A2V3IEF9_9FLOR|nr:30S ribosomal protein S18 [Gracilariopsis chorda]|eukprot:PXF40457.1 30S ribosomal protein S18 [Gracilariopsis chorda]
MSLGMSLLRFARHTLGSTKATKGFLPFRALATDNNEPGSELNERKERANADKSDGFFSEENISDLSPLEVARMRVTYGLLKEHVEAIEKGLEDVDPESNPLIDPRSFQTRKLPQIPKEVLEQFRKEVPPEVAAESRVVSTYNLWEALQSGETHELLEEQSTQEDWSAVDERTMDTRSYTKLQRQAVLGQKVPSHAPSAAMNYMAKRKMNKSECALKDDRGRSVVDFRAVESMKAYLSDNLKILPRRKSGLCAKSQRKLARAVKTARSMALLNPEPIPELTVEEMRDMEKNLS